jgi:PIN domain nuclease of toxin-antitoxin system
VKILLDTHAFLWAITDDPRLSQVHRSQYLEPRNELFLSVASLWEMLIKSGIGKLTLPAPAVPYLVKQMEKNRVSLLGVQLSHLSELETLPPLHRDPFDRMIVAQARAERMPVMSDDPALRNYDVSLL